MKKKIKYQGGITKKIGEWLAGNAKKNFSKYFHSELPLAFKDQAINIEVISFSGSISFEDQLLSLYSFKYYVGIPIRWTVYSDNSITDEQIQILKKKFAFVEVKNWDAYSIYLENKLIGDYLKICHLAKKLNVLLGHSYDENTIYVDSDVVFYENSSYYLKFIDYNKLWFAPDTMWGNLGNLLNKKLKDIYPLNSGFLIFNKNFEKTDIFEYLESLDGNYEYFSEQSSIEYAFKKQHAEILDPRQFIIDCTDQFDFNTKYHPHEIALRHYVGPVRHKMWQNNWSWHFML